jgi:hypothetical protein
MDFVALNKITRQNTLAVIDGLSLAQLNTVPEGSNNSIFWNLAHMYVTQQLLTLGLQGADMMVSKEMITKYRKGSDGSVAGTQEEWDLIQKDFLPIIDRTQNIIAKGIDTPYKTYTTSYNSSLTSVTDGVEFNNVHEALHLGVIMALKKRV